MDMIRARGLQKTKRTLSVSTTLYRGSIYTFTPYAIPHYNNYQYCTVSTPNLKAKLCFSSNTTYLTPNSLRRSDLTKSA